MRRRGGGELRATSNLQVGAEAGRDLPQSIVRTPVAFRRRLEQSNKLELIETGIREDCFDDRRLVPSRQQNFDLPGDRFPIAVGSRQKFHRTHDLRQPSVIHRNPSPHVDLQCRHCPRQDRIEALSNEPWFVTTRRWLLIRPLNHHSVNLGKKFAKSLRNRLESSHQRFQLFHCLGKPLIFLQLCVKCRSM